MREVLLIALGGAVGALGRWSVGALVQAVVGRHFPWGTFVVNVVGSVLMGLVLTVPFHRGGWLTPPMRVALTAGVLGAFTTFSTFSFETLELLRSGAYGSAAVNVGLSVVACVGGCWLGVLAGRAL